MKHYSNLGEIRTDLDNGIEIFWVNTSYKVHYIIAGENCTPFTVKDGKAIRVSCISNYFGSVLNEEEIGRCFSKETI
jgi:hypothetical protein